MRSFLEIVEVIRKLEQGKTQPYLCRAEDQSRYVVKGKSALAKGCMNEWICANLGKRFGLPIPNFQILEFPEELLDLDPNYGFDLGSEAPLFGSCFKEHLEELNREILSKIDR